MTRTKSNKIRDTRSSLGMGSFIPDGEGVVMPQSAQLEEVVIGAALLDKVASSMVCSRLDGKHFYDPVWATVMTAMKHLFDTGSRIDMVIVMQQLRKDVGAAEAKEAMMKMANATNKIASTANLEVHIALLLQQWMKREAIRMGQEMVRDGYDESKDALEMLSDYQNEMLQVSGSVVIRQAEPSTVGSKEFLEDVLNVKYADHVNGVHTGYKDLDLVTGGWQPSDMIVIAARPGNGKTAFALNTAWRAAAKHGKKVLFCSLEMPNKQIKARLLAMITTATTHCILTGRTTEWEKQQILNYGYLHSHENLWLDDTPGITPGQLRSKVIYMKAKTGCDMVVVDYLQLMSSGLKNETNEEQRVSTISRSLKSIAQEFNIPVIALSQLSREVEKRGGKKPQISDLRASGSIEQDASLVGFLYNPYRAGAQKDDGSSWPENYTELLIQKHRNGALIDIGFNYYHQCNRFLGLGESSGEVYHVVPENEF